MIAVDRSLAQAPPLGVPGIKEAQANARAFFGSRSRAVRQRRYEFDRSWLDQPLVMASLATLFSGRCAFCNSRGGDAYPLLVHHFRPPQDAVAADGKTSRRHYWWLFYEWENLYPACPECDRAKGAKFPIARQRARVGITEEGLDREMPLLLDPCREDPEEVLVYLDSGEVVSRDERGQATIETFDLNRPDLVQQRKSARPEVEEEIKRASVALQRSRYDEFLAGLERLYDPDRAHAAQRRQMVNQWAQVRPRQIEIALDRGWGDSASFEAMVGSLTRVTNRVKEEAATVFFGEEEAPQDDRRMRGGRIGQAPAQAQSSARLNLAAGRSEGEWSYLDVSEIRRVEIRNFRAIDRLSLRLVDQSGPGSWLMLLGENATGKSSVLQAIALALSSEETIRRLPVEPSSLLRDGTEEGFVKLELTGSRRLRELYFGRDLDSFVHAGYSEGILVAGYGSTRLLPRHPGGREVVSKVDGLFDPFVPLDKPADWLPDLPEEEFDAIARALKQLLDLDDDDELRQTEDGIELIRDKSRFSLSRLSDGYQAMAGFGLDMMRMFSKQWGSIEAAEGIVLVDELGTHLHPRWQMKVVGSLREAFPRVQFIATTHDPLCLRGLHDGEVAVLRRSGSRTYALQEDLPSVDGLAVDQLLTSEHFGLGSTLDPKLEDLLDRYYELRGRHGLSAQEQEELARLSAELGHFRLLGVTLRERLALEAADNFIAKGRRAKDAGEYYELKELTKKVISRVWEEGLPR